ncbi:MAG: hypothetical protein HOE90_05105 [Bacteriovoracaceae bacterium]|jgi:hypothetical protein|nr:hypothetical protein [Bacteriovoracaceae bacterium]
MKKQFVLIRNLFTLALVSTSINAFAATATSTTAAPSFKDSLDLKFYATTEQMKGEKKQEKGAYETTGFVNVLESTFGYALTKSDYLELYGAVTYTVNNDDDNEFQPDSTQFKYKRKNILTEDKHGVGLSADIRSFHLLSDESRDALSWNGAIVPNLSLSRKVTSWLSVYTTLRYYMYYRTKATVGTSKNQFRVYLTPSFTITDKLSAGTMFKYKHTDRVGKAAPGKHDQSDSLQFIPSVAYDVAKNANIELYADATLMKSYDDETISKTAGDDFVIGATLSLTAF